MPVEILGDDRVVRRLDDGSEIGEFLLGRGF
jgi:hypothetical protein